MGLILNILLSLLGLVMIIGAMTAVGWTSLFWVLAISVVLGIFAYFLCDEWRKRP